MSDKEYSNKSSYCPILDEEHKLYKEAYEDSLKPVRKYLRSHRDAPIPHEIDVVYKKALSRLREYLDVNGLRMPQPKYPLYPWSNVT